MPGEYFLSQFLLFAFVHDNVVWNPNIKVWLRSRILFVGKTAGKSKTWPVALRYCWAYSIWYSTEHQHSSFSNTSAMTGAQHMSKSKTWPVALECLWVQSISHSTNTNTLAFKTLIGHREFNPWGGCRPGVDCPWFPDKHGKSHCTSSANFAGIYNVHETVEMCCSEHFYNVNSCVESSTRTIKAQKETVQKRLKRPRYYWPDLHGKQNCVFDSDYNDWMEGSVSFFTQKHLHLDWVISLTCPCFPKSTAQKLVSVW